MRLNHSPFFGEDREVTQTETEADPMEEHSLLTHSVACILVFLHSTGPPA